MVPNVTDQTCEINADGIYIGYFNSQKILLKLQAYMLFSGVNDIYSHIKHPNAWKRNAKWKMDLK